MSLKKNGIGTTYIHGNIIFYLRYFSASQIFRKIQNMQVL